MPLYEFNCKKCKKKIEILLMGGEAPVCPDCKGVDLERLFSVFASPGVQGGHGSSCATCAPHGGCSHCSCK